MTLLLYLNVLIIATCGLVYELVAGTLASYVLGDSVTQFSLCIGIYLFALGVGAWLSSFVRGNLARAFIEVEFAVAILGGGSAPLLFVLFAYTDLFRGVLYAVVFGIGVLVGLELPLLMRILKSRVGFEQLIARVLTFDYIGALIGSLLFPLLLVPRLGLVRTSLVLGLLNGLVGLWGTWLLRPILNRGIAWMRIRGGIVLGVLIVAIVFAERFTTFAEAKIYTDPVVYSRTTPYQRIVVTRNPSQFRLFLDGKLQFDSFDEYRYHEALVHPAMQLAARRRNVLVLGGGDGLALREVLRCDDVESVVLVDLDPAMTELSRAFPPLAELNGRAFDDPRVSVENADAFVWLKDGSGGRFDVMIVDFPDPNDFAVGKLYTRQFYRMLKQRLAPGGTIAVQSTSPLFARRSFWCIHETMAAAGFSVRPYQVSLPSFGVWGFVLARHEPFDPPDSAPGALRFLNDRSLAAMFSIPEDLAPLPVEVNRLDNQVLVRYYDRE